MASAFDALMSQDVNLIKQEKDLTGSLSDDTTYEEKGFIEYTSKRVVNDKGEQIDLKAIVYLKAVSNYDETHPTWSVENGQRFKVQTVEKVVDPRTNTLHHWELGVI